MKVVAVVQCTSSDLGRSLAPADYCIDRCKTAPFLDDLILACPDDDTSDRLEEVAGQWDVPLFRGSEFNVCSRVLEAARSRQADIVVRVLLRQFYLDLDQLKRMIDALIEENADYVMLPSEYNYALVGDVSRFSALEKTAAAIENIDCEKMRASLRFSPWIYMETHPAEYQLVEVDGGEMYAPDRVESIRQESARIFSENQSHFSANFPASSYNFIGSRIEKHWSALDIACGKGQGVKALSSICRSVIGVDYEQSHIDEAKEVTSGIDNVELYVGNAENFHLAEAVDVVISLHTLEHLEHPGKFLECAHQNLGANGRLYLEVPLLLPVPLGRPLVPWHDKEYAMQELVDMVLAHGFEVSEVWAKQRHVFVQLGYKNKRVQTNLPRRLTAGLIMAEKKG